MLAVGFARLVVTGDVTGQLLTNWPITMPVLANLRARTPIGAGTPLAVAVHGRV